MIFCKPNFILYPLSFILLTLSFYPYPLSLCPVPFSTTLYLKRIVRNSDIKSVSVIDPFDQIDNMDGHRQQHNFEKNLMMACVTIIIGNWLHGMIPAKATVMKIAESVLHQRWSTK